MSSASSIISKDEAPSRNWSPVGLKGWAKTVHVYHTSHIAIDCSNPDHFAKKKANVYQIKNYREGDAVPVPKAPADVLALMKPFQVAACACERRACQEAWNWNAPGVFQGDFVMRPNYFKGTGEIKKDVPQKRVMPVNFRLSPRDFKILHDRFPDWHFVQTGNGGHDHPISHVTTQVVTFEVLSKLKKRGSYLDVHGNPTSNETFMRGDPNRPKVDTFVSLVSAKDFVRAKTKWGPQKVGDKLRWHTGPYIRDFDVHNRALGENRDGFLSFHTGYYYEMDEILSILRCSPDATFTMVMHRFEGSSGSFNNGELLWEKKEGMITQTNAKTGERYTHPDNSRWFQSSAWTRATALQSLKRVESPTREDPDRMVDNPAYDELRGLAWTTNMACEGVYIVTVVGCPAYAALLDESHKVQEFAHNSPRAVAANGGISLESSAGTVFVPIAAEHQQVFDDCRALMRNKPRTEDKFKAHCAAVSVKCKSLLRDSNVRVDSEQLGHIQKASFWVDFKADAYDNITQLTEAQWYVTQHDLALKGKGLNRAGNLLGLVLDVVAEGLRAKSGKDTVAAVVKCAKAISVHTM